LSEDHGNYDHAEPDEPAGGVKPIGDILRQVIDERGWPLPAVYSGPNGDSRDDRACRYE
jgi:hypothetical protein